MNTYCITQVSNTWHGVQHESLLCMSVSNVQAIAYLLCAVLLVIAVYGVYRSILLIIAGLYMMFRK